MAFDGFITKSIITELKNLVINAKVNKIWQPNKNDIILSLYNSGINSSLLLSANPDNCRICLTQYQRPNPQNALNFCMLLRKYLTGAKIIDISNMDLERTVQIKFECYNEMNDLVVRKLYLEIMSRQSNIVLTNQNDVIIDSIKHFDNSLPAHIFSFAPIIKTSFLKINNFTEFLEIYNKETDIPNSLISKFTSLFIGFSAPTVSKALEILNIDNYEYSNSDLEKIFIYFKNLLNSIEENNSTKYNIENFDKDYTIFYLDSENNKTKINNFIDTFYYEKEELSTFTNYRNNLLKVILSNLKKLYKKLENINRKLDSCNDMEKYKLYGELLTANLYKVNNNSNLTEITVENYYDNNSPLTIPLDNTIGVQKNVEKFFKKYNKLKNTLEIVSEQKKEAEKEIDYIESIVFSLENANDLEDISEIYEEVSETLNLKKKLVQSRTQNKKLKLNAEHNFRIFDIDGFKVYVGKNNIQNDYLTLKFATKKDYWFHTQTVHGSHVILKNPEDKEIPVEVLYECAKLACKYSKAANSSNTPVDYCPVKFVKKPSGAKPGKVIYTNYKTIYVK